MGKEGCYPIIGQAWGEGDLSLFIITPTTPAATGWDSILLFTKNQRVTHKVVHTLLPTTLREVDEHVFAARATRWGSESFPALPGAGGHGWGGAWEFGPEPFPSLCPCSLSQNSITDVGACKLAEALPSLAASLLRLR